MEHSPAARALASRSREVDRIRQALNKFFIDLDIDSTEGLAATVAFLGENLGIIAADNNINLPELLEATFEGLGERAMRTYVEAMLRPTGRRK